MKTTKAEAVPQATTEVGTTEQVENSNTEAANTSATNITVFDEKEDVMVSGNNDTNTNSTTNAGNATAMVEETKAETTLNPPVETSEVVTETGYPLATMVAEHHDMLMVEEVDCVSDLRPLVASSHIANPPRLSPAPLHAHITAYTDCLSLGRHA